MKIDKGARENFLSRAWGKFVKITDGYGCRSYRRCCRKTLRVFPTKGVQSAARLFYTLTMAAMALFTKADHDFMARTVYHLTQKSLLCQAGTRRKLLMDTSAGLTGDTVFCFFQKRDQGGAAGLGLGELHRSLDLGQHGALGELILVHIDLGLGGGQII